MSSGPPQVMWQGKYVRAIKAGQWEYVSRTNDVRAVVILAEHEGKYILVEQLRVPTGRRCIELPAGLVGDEDPDATIEGTAVKELEEEAGFTAAHIERLGEFYSSPGMVAEGYTLVRAHNVQPGGTKSEEAIDVHLVAADDIPAFIADMRRNGRGVDVKLLLLLASSIIAEPTPV